MEPGHVAVDKKVKGKVAQSCLRPLGLYSPWNSPGQNTGVGSLFLLQRIFPTQELNRGSPSLQADSLPTELSGKPGSLLMRSWASTGPQFTVIDLPHADDSPVSL